MFLRCNGRYMNYEDRKYLYLFESMSVWSSLDSENVILYFACHMMFDRRSRNLFSMTPVVVTVKQLKVLKQDECAAHREYC